MRIVRLSRFLPPKVGGLEFHVLELTRRQSLLGHQLEVFYAQGQPPPLPGVRWTRVPLPGWAGRVGSNLVQSLAFAWGARRLLAAAGAQADLVHAHGDIGEAVATWLAGRRLGCPAVLTLHGELNGALAYRLVARLLFRLPRRLLVVSPRIRDTLESLGVPAERIRVFSSGVDCAAAAQPDPGLEADLRAELGLEAGCPVVISVGRLHPVKGYGYLVEAGKQVLDRCPRARILIVGEGEERPRLTQAIRAEHRIVLAGQRSRAEVFALLRLGSVFVLPSVDLGSQAEGSPSSILEAMAAGLPVVVSDSGGLARLIHPGEHGYVVPERSAGALAERILHLLEHPEEAARIGGTNARVAAERDWGRQARAITESCQELVER